jgi:molecular chaperone GrpE
MSDQFRERTATEQEAPAAAGASPVGEPAEADTEAAPAGAATGGVADQPGVRDDTAAGAAAEAGVPGSDTGAEGEPAAAGKPGAVGESGEEAGAQDKPDGEAGAQDEGDKQVVADLDALTAKAAKADEYLDLAKRTQADFENYRKRAIRDAALAQQRGIAALAKELLPAIDSLERALVVARDAHQQIAEGIELTQSELLAALSRVGIESFAPKGEPFDPTVHEAVVQQPAEGVESGTVIEVFQTGYRLGELVLRPARVMVAA